MVAHGLQFNLRIDSLGTSPKVPKTAVHGPLAFTLRMLVGNPAYIVVCEKLRYPDHNNAVARTVSNYQCVIIKISVGKTPITI